MTYKLLIERTTLGVETFAWRNFRGKTNARNFVHFAWINFRGWTQHENFTLINFHENFGNGKCFLFNIAEGIDFKKTSQLLFSLVNTYILYIKTVNVNKISSPKFIVENIERGSF